ncbi:MAG: iron-sulfur cluster assembly scaffold protein [Desulforhopalus sp.]
MSIFTIFSAFLVLLVVGLTWFFIYYFGNPVLDNPDGIAQVVGNCGDTMEIGLKIRDGRVEKTHHWTNGCSFSKHCVETAAKLAQTKTLAELRKINMVSIMDEVGQLPETHLHCAQLAEITLQRSLENYLDRQRNQSAIITKS